ncbi:MAG: SulA-like leucine-rich domain-containing protein [Marinobacter sp.]|uniref:cell division inhibitor SulA n=1 Tax=Marinobacter sp. TaxID=50741 RepID=UPI00299E8EBA|nr:SulA-like leucine-rich domain-containing protein [Marinobacter sp.]MDX1633458.1 SulA-like leucine-rich domain-containing protein [Marinobacter sp.]
MEQLSFNQNLAYAPVSHDSIRSGREARVIGSVSIGTSAAVERQGQAVRLPESGEGGGSTEAVTGNVTEIILPAGQVENFQLLLPMLTQLNQERRWLAWIDPPQALVNKWQTMRGIIAGEILVLRSSEQHPALDLGQRALSAGTCHAVVMWTGKLGRQAFQSLQQASAAGNSHGVVLRQR